MTLLSLIAFVFGVFGVWLTIKQNILCWPVSIIAVLASIVEFYEQRLFGDMALQIFYFFAALYGWIFWNRQKNRAFVVTKMLGKNWSLLILITFAQSFLYYFLLSYFKGDQPVFDAILTASSLTATYMMTRKWLENWAAWVLIDFAYVFLYNIKEMWLFVVLYLVFGLIALYGWIKWRKTV
jgi:nicotinamide mononucleotide transporter